MPMLYNRYVVGPAVEFTAEMAAIVLANGSYVATLGEVTPGTPPAPPPLPPLTGGGVQSGPPYSVAGAPVALEALAAADWLRLLDQSSGTEVRAQLSALVPVIAAGLALGGTGLLASDGATLDFAELTDWARDLLAAEGVDASGLLSIATPADLGGAASAGTMTAAARGDHVHRLAAVIARYTGPMAGRGPSDTDPIGGSFDDALQNGWGWRWRQTDGGFELFRRVSGVDKVLFSCAIGSGALWIGGAAGSGSLRLALGPFAVSLSVTGGVNPGDRPKIHMIGLAGDGFDVQSLGGGVKFNEGIGLFGMPAISRTTVSGSMPADPVLAAAVQKIIDLGALIVTP